MAKIRVAVVFGGMSNEYEVSLVSATHVIRSIPSDKYEVICIGITKKGHWLHFIGDLDLIAQDAWEKNPDNVHCVLSPDPLHKGFVALLDDGTVKTIKVDVVFPVIHGKNGEDGTIQGLFQMAGIPFVGCDVISSANCMDKEFTHIILESAGIPMAKYRAVYKSDLDRLDEKAAEISRALTYPLFVKPANAGSSVGVSKAHDAAELVRGIRLAFAHDDKVIVEQGIVGKECECAVLGNADPIASTVGEIEPENEFYDYAAKYQSAGGGLFIPARIPQETIEAVRATALKAFRAINCKGLARIDFFCCADGTVILNEINTMPGFTAISMYPKLMGETGMTQGELMDRLIMLGMERARRYE
ncbi:MAG: D-alanine--D-alanine ligase family protein [Oscillospiraceae bacterium]